MTLYYPTQNIAAPASGETPGASRGRLRQNIIGSLQHWITTGKCLTVFWEGVTKNGELLVEYTTSSVGGTQIRTLCPNATSFTTNGRRSQFLLLRRTWFLIAMEVTVPLSYLTECCLQCKVATDDDSAVKIWVAPRPGTSSGLESSARRTEI